MGALTPHNQAPHTMEPLRRSWESPSRPIEGELKAVFLQVFDAMIRPRLEAVNAYGMAHRATDFGVVERFTKQDGIAAYRVTGREEFMRELYRGWRARNPRRGLDFLKFYLQMMFPNQWSVDQLWQRKTLAYTSNMSTFERPGDYLTSRVLVSVSAASLTDADLLQRIGPSLRSVLPARLLMQLVIGQPAKTTVRVAAVVFPATHTLFTGTL